jgi:hypothetical protein
MESLASSNKDAASAGVERAGENKTDTMKSPGSIVPRFRSMHDWQRDLQDSSIVPRDIDFSLSSIPWKLELSPKNISQEESDAAETSYPPVDYLTFWNVQSHQYDDYKLNQGQAAMTSGAFSAATQNFHEGLEVLPEHEGLGNAMRQLEEKRNEPKSVLAFEQKAAQALHDAVMEKWMKQGEAVGVASAVAPMGNSSLYPLLPNESSSENGNPKTHKRHKKKQLSHCRKHPKQNAEDGSSTRTTESTAEPECKRRRRKRSKQHYNVGGKSARLDDDCVTVDSFEVERKRRKRIKRKRQQEEPTNDSVDSASTDSRRVPKKRRRAEPYRYKNNQDDDSITP